MRVEQVAGGRPCTLPGWLTCGHGLAIVRSLDVSTVPVVEDARVIGVATRQTLRAAPTYALIRCALAPRPTACQTRQSVGEGLALMHARRVSDLPVLDEAGRPVGRLRLQDALRALKPDDKRSH